ncbi:MAG: hypothetical protein ACP5N1_03055 [Candidatus Woesearchaeota archaeon]
MEELINIDTCYNHLGEATLAERRKDELDLDALERRFRKNVQSYLIIYNIIVIKMITNYFYLNYINYP